MTPLPTACLEKAKRLKVAVVGGGLGGLMAARELARQGVKVTLFEARPEVGGRVLSNTRFADGRVIEAGAELLGTFHKRWKRLAHEYGLGWITRTGDQDYANMGLALKLTLDKPLTAREAQDLAEEMRKRVLVPISMLARQVSDAARPWLQSSLQKYDQMSVASALTKLFGVDKAKDRRLWMAVEHLLVNDNGSTLEAMNLLGLLCLVKGGQLGAHDDPPMGYWDELELYRCADGAQSLALNMAAEAKKRWGATVMRQTVVSHIDLSAQGAGLGWYRVDKHGQRYDKQVPGAGRFDHVVLAAPPGVWSDIQITPQHPKDVIGTIGHGPAVKFFANVRSRFWIKNRAAPSGGSPALGQVWEGTDNQTQNGKQDSVLAVFAGGRVMDPAIFEPELEKLYPGFKTQLKRRLYANWPAERFIKTGCTAPRLGEIFTVSKALSEPFRDRLVFAGDHACTDLFGYMEGALASGERAAQLVLEQACGLREQRRPEPLHVAEAQPEPEAEAIEAEVIDKDSRVRVLDTKAVPSRWICAIDIRFENPNYGGGGPKLLAKARGSGTLIGPRHVLTARHILQAQDIEIDGRTHRLPVHSLLVSPGRNGHNQRHPLGSATSRTWHLATPFMWPQRKLIGGQWRTVPIRWHDDYALVILDGELPATLGWWGQVPSRGQLRRHAPAALQGQAIDVNGYPGDRCGADLITGDTAQKKRRIEYCAQRRPDEWASTPWASRGSAEATADSTWLLHDADTYEGQSGAPICLRVGQRLDLAGVHTGAHDASRNRGVRVTRRLLEELVGWINQHAGRTIARVDQDALVFDPPASPEAEVLQETLLVSPAAPD
jgi:monoamine oxidase/V8-like Glu-specific endopeptidase